MNPTPTIKPLLRLRRKIGASELLVYQSFDPPEVDLSNIRVDRGTSAPTFILSSMDGPLFHNFYWSLLL